MPNPFGGAAVIRRRHRDHPVVVGQRLAHPHEHDVGQPVPVLVPQRRRGRADLLQDLGGRQVAGQPALAGRAERAGHAAAGLRGDAHGVALRVAHQHRLDGGAVAGPPQRLAGLPRIALDLPDRGQQRREQRLGQPAAQRRGQIGHRGRVGGQPAVVLVGQLFGPKRRQAQVGDRLQPAGLVEVGEMPRRHLPARGLEDKFLFHCRPVSGPGAHSGESDRDRPGVRSAR
jgi:hypothetical protein